jgi:cytokinesis protein
LSTLDDPSFLVNFQDVRKGATELRDGLQHIRLELGEHFTDLELRPPTDLYGKKMWKFVGDATNQLDDLMDQVKHAESTLLDVLKYYGEDERTMTSSEFYGIFKTFVTSYRVCFCHHQRPRERKELTAGPQKCKAENDAIEEVKAAAEARTQAAAARAQMPINADGSPDSSVLDTLIEKLRSGETMPRRRGTRGAHRRQGGGRASGRAWQS